MVANNFDGGNRSYSWGYRRSLCTSRTVREKRNIEIKVAKAAIRNTLRNNESSLEYFKYFSLGEIQEISNNAVYIPKKLLRELSEIIDLANEYNTWRHECYEVINAEVRAQSKQYPFLDEAFLKVFRSGFEYVLDGVDGSRSEEIYRAIYQGDLTFDKAKESLLKGYWDNRVTIRYKSSDEKELMFKDIIEGEDFHRFCTELIKLQKRESLVILRDTRSKLLEKQNLV